MKYKTLNPVRHNGTLYAEGATIELADEADAARLVACGAIAPQAESEAPPKAKASHKSKETRGNKGK